MFSFHPMTNSGHLNDPSGAVAAHPKVMPSLGASVLPSALPEGPPSSPPFAHPNQLMQCGAGGTSPAGGVAMSAGTFPQLQPFFAALARNLANISPQHQQTTPRCPAPSHSNAFPSSPFCFAHPGTLLAARPQSAKQQKRPQQSSPPIGDAQQQQQFMANWLNMLMMMSNSSGNGCDNAAVGGGGGAPQGEVAKKALESDSDGNSVCPACKEPIGTELTQWESHLEAERTRLREEIESLRVAVLEVHGIAISAETTATAHAHDEQRGEAEIALERIRESQRRRVIAKVRGHFFTASPILSTLISRNSATSSRNEDERGDGDSVKQRDDGTTEASNDARQNANGFTVSPFSALQLARGFPQKEEGEEEEEEEVMKRMSPEDMKRTSPEEMKRMSPEEMKRMSPKGMKRLSPEWMKRISAEEIKRSRMEL